MKTNKELKNEYKQMKMPIGVFQIKNISNGKVLIEGSTNMETKWNRHKTELKFGTHRNVALQNDWKELGEEQFKFEVLSIVEQKDGENLNYNEEVKVLESMILEELKPFGEKGYNK